MTRCPSTGGPVRGRTRRCWWRRTATRGGVSNKVLEYTGWGMHHRELEAPATMLGAAWHPDGSHLLLCGERGALLRAEGETVAPIASGTRDNLVGPFWRAGVKAPIALMLKGPDEKVYTI